MKEQESRNSKGWSEKGDRQVKGSPLTFFTRRIFFPRRSSGGRAGSLFTP
jgi:hypothetical protein